MQSRIGPYCVNTSGKISSGGQNTADDVVACDQGPALCANIPSSNNLMVAIATNINGISGWTPELRRHRPIGLVPELILNKPLVLRSGAEDNLRPVRLLDQVESGRIESTDGIKRDLRRGGKLSSDRKSTRLNSSHANI